jgi:hypothetical protein
MNVQETTDMVARLMKDVGLVPTTQGHHVSAIVEPLRRLTVRACDYFPGGFRTLPYVNRIVIRTDHVGVYRYGRVLARTFTARVKDRTFNEAGILKGLRELAQVMRDDAAQKDKRAQDRADEDRAKMFLRDALERFGVNMNSSNHCDCFDGQAKTRFGKVTVHVKGGKAIKVRLPEFETTEQVAKFLELIK